jgi:hypothetical protein
MNQKRASILPRADAGPPNALSDYQELPSKSAISEMRELN